MNLPDMIRIYFTWAGVIESFEKNLAIASEDAGQLLAASRAEGPSTQVV